jgi:hypothetical protein
MTRFFGPALLLFASVLQTAAQSVEIPSNPAVTTFGPLTILYPTNWNKRDARIGEGVVLESPQPISVAGQSLKLVAVLGKDPNPGKTLDEFKAMMSEALGQQAKTLNENIQKVVGTEAARKGIQVQLTEVGTWSLDIEKQNGTNVLRSSFTGVQSLNGQPVTIFTRGLFYVTPEGIYSVTLAYPTSVKGDYEPFVDWLLKHVGVTPK